MRISVNEDDPGYVHDDGSYKVIFNDKEIDNCVTADEETGYVLCNKQDIDGNWILDREKEIIIQEEFFGKVVIKRV